MKIIYSRLAYEKIQYFVHRTKEEISGFGIVELTEEGLPYVTDVILLDQVNSGTQTEIDALAICKAEDYMMKNKIKGEIKVWWHSHNSMPTEWSGQDFDTIDILGTHGWFICSVFNNKGESKSCFVDCSPKDKLGFDYSVFHDDIQLLIHDNIPNEVFEQCEKEYKEKVKELVWIPKEKKIEEVKEKKGPIKMFCEDCGHEFVDNGDIFDCPTCHSYFICNEEEYSNLLDLTNWEV